MKSRISRDPQIQSGAYCIRGTRVPVWAIKDCADCWTDEQILREFPSLTQADIDAALAFRAGAHLHAIGRAA